MNKLILIFLFFFSFLYSDYYLISSPNPSPISSNDGLGNFYKVTQFYYTRWAPSCSDGGSYYLSFAKRCVNIEKVNNIKYNLQCLVKNYSYSVSGLTRSGYCLNGIRNISDCGYVYVFSSIPDDFCIPKKGYVYDPKDNLWHPNDPEEVPICPEGKIFDDKSGSCIDSKCNDLKCPPTQIKDPVKCICVCIGPMIHDETGRCVPNPNLDEEECKKAGGVYMENSLFDTFSSIDNAIVSFYAPPGEHWCYAPDWIKAKKKELKASVSPENVLKGAIGLLPFAKVLKFGKWLGLGEDIEKIAETPKNLLENKPVIETKYNPDTGLYEPIIDLKPRETPLPENNLLNLPGSIEEAEDILKPTKDLDDFLRSKFAEAAQDDEGLTGAIVAYDLETAPERSTETAIMSDLREIFKRSEPDTSSTNFPAVIDDFVGADKSLPVEVSREIKPVNTEAPVKIYDVTYNISPKTSNSNPNPVSPVKVVYQVQVQPASSLDAKPIVKATPQYVINNKTIQGSPVYVTNNYYNTINNNSQTINNNSQSQNEPQPEPDYTSFQNPAESAIKNAFNYKISLFSCPDVSPSCPNTYKINYHLAGIKGEYNISDPMCAVISTIDNPKISPLIDKVAGMIVLFAGVMGALTLFRRD